MKSSFASPIEGFPITKESTSVESAANEIESVAEVSDLAGEAHRNDHAVQKGDLLFLASSYLKLALASSKAKIL